MSTVSTRLPAWLQRHGVTGLCLLVVLLISLSLSQQSIDLLHLLRSPAANTPAPAAAPSQAISIERLQNLFGVPAHMRDSRDAPPTRQRMTLLASFVNPQAERSAAIIQSAGDKPKRVTVGGQVNASTRLQAVYRDHVVLERDGHEESLQFPAARSPARAPSASPVGFAAEQLQQLQDENIQGLQQRLHTLQQRMEGNGDTPTAETDTKDNP